MTRRLFVCLGLAIALSSCGYQRIQVKVTRPAAINLASYGSVAVDAFEGKGGADISEDISIGLSRANNPVTGSKAVTVVDRQNLDRILDELKIQHSGLWDKDTVSRLGKLVGARALIHGRVSRYDVTENIAVNTIQNEDGSRTLIKTRSAEARLTVYIRTSDTGTGQIIDEIKFEEKDAQSTYAYTTPQDNAQPNSIDHGALLSALRKRVTNGFLQRVVPYETFVSVVLFVEDKFPQLAEGNRWAQAGRWDKSIELYRDAEGSMTGQLGQLRWKAKHNLGVALLFSNQFEEARKNLEEAYAQENQQVIFQQLQEVDVREEEYQKLMAQGAVSDS